MTDRNQGELKIKLGHGSGGKQSQELYQEVFLPAFGNRFLDEAHDGAILTMGNSKIAFSTDTFTVNPLFFPGGKVLCDNVSESNAFYCHLSQRSGLFNSLNH